MDRKPSQALVRFVVRLLFRLLARVETHGLENISSGGGMILAVNHLSRLDAPLVYVMLRRQKLTALVADKYQKNPIFRWLVNVVDGIWIRREEADVQALRASRDYLQSGGALGIAPEGTRSKNGKLGPAKTGVAYLADKAGVPVAPVAVWGTEKAFNELARLHRPSIHLSVGKPFILPPVGRSTRDADLRRNTDEIMAQIAVLLPEEYRGFYTGHPRVAELLDRTEAASLPLQGRGRVF